MVYIWVYTWIFLDIPSFLKPDFTACLCCWSHSMSTRVWVIKSVLFHVPQWQLCQGKGSPQKAQLDAADLPPVLLAVVVTAAAAVV